MKFSIVAILAITVSTVYGQAPSHAGIAVNLPSLGQVVTAGSTFTITWSIDTNVTNPSNAINSISLMRGGSANLEYYISNFLTSPIPVTPSSYNWNIPANIETNPSYVLALAGNNGATTYSTYFTIVGASPGSTNHTVPPAPNANAAGSPASNANKSSPSNGNNSTSSGNNLKAGVIGTASIVGAVALLF